VTLGLDTIAEVGVLEIVKWLATAIAVVTFLWSIPYLVKAVFLGGHGRRLRNAGDDDREAATQAAVRFLKLDVSGISAGDQVEVVMAEIWARWRRNLMIWLVIETVWLLATILAFIAFFVPEILGLSETKPA